MVSVVVVTLNEGDNLRATLENLRATLPEGGEIVVVDDGSTDGSTDSLAGASGPVRLVRPSSGSGLSQARNFGARQARGDVIVFSDAHITAPPDWWRPMLDLLANPNVGAVAPAVSVMGKPNCVGYGLRLGGPSLDAAWLDCQKEEPYPVPLLPGGFMAMRREVFDSTGGFDDGMVRWGSEDSEISIRLWLLGYECWVVPRVDVAHLFREQHPYTVQWAEVIHNKLRIALLHFAGPRIARVVDALRGHHSFGSAMALAVNSDFAARRAELASARRHDDEWFFGKFGLEW